MSDTRASRGGGARTGKPGTGNSAGAQRGFQPGPVRAGDLLKGLMADVGTKAARSDLSEALSEAVGPDRAPHCQVLGFRGGRLQVAVDSAPLHAEMAGFLREDLRRQINDRLPNRKVARIDFRLRADGGSKSF